MVRRQTNDDDIVTPESRWTTETPVYRTGLTTEGWLAFRRTLVRNYHTSTAQQAHWDRKIAEHPELGFPIRTFQAQLQQ